MSKKRDRAEKDLAEAEWWEAEVVERLHDRAKKAEAHVKALEEQCCELALRDERNRKRVAELENRVKELEEIVEWRETFNELKARLEAAERVVEAARLAREELRHAPCRDNPQHTLCLKCAAERALDEALAAWEEAKQC